VLGFTDDTVATVHYVVIGGQPSWRSMTT